MAIFYKGGEFFDEYFSEVPLGALEISRECYDEIFDKLEQNYILSEDDKGYPIAVEMARREKVVRKENTQEDFIQHQKRKRKIAYITEADPLFFKWQRDEIPKQVWLDKVQEIKNKYPI